MAREQTSLFHACAMCGEVVESRDGVCAWCGSAERIDIQCEGPASMQTRLLDRITRSLATGAAIEDRQPA